MHSRVCTSNPTFSCGPSREAAMVSPQLGHVARTVLDSASAIAEILMNKLARPDVCDPLIALSAIKSRAVITKLRSNVFGLPPRRARLGILIPAMLGSLAGDSSKGPRQRDRCKHDPLRRFSLLTSAALGLSAPALPAILRLIPARTATLDLSLPPAKPITLTRGPCSHLVTLMDAAIPIRDLEPFCQGRPVRDRTAEMILLVAATGKVADVQEATRHCLRP